MATFAAAQSLAGHAHLIVIAPLLLPAIVMTLRLAGPACSDPLLSSVSAPAGPKVVSRPRRRPVCFKPWSSETKFF